MENNEKKYITKTNIIIILTVVVVLIITIWWYLEQNKEVENGYSGIGVTLEYASNSKIKVLKVVEKSPAQKAGILKGDIIKAVDNISYTDYNLAAEAMRGKIGTTVKIKVIRDGKEKSFRIKRKVIENNGETNYSPTPYERKEMNGGGDVIPYYQPTYKVPIK